jgi:hypothetical protein
MRFLSDASWGEQHFQALVPGASWAGGEHCHHIPYDFICKNLRLEIKSGHRQGWVTGPFDRFYFRYDWKISKPQLKAADRIILIGRLVNDSCIYEYVYYDIPMSVVRSEIGRSFRIIKLEGHPHWIDNFQVTSAELITRYTKTDVSVSLTRRGPP